VIDTSGSADNCKDITGTGVDTEFIPFNGSGGGFIMHISFKSIPSEQPNPPLVEDTEDRGANYLYNIFSAQDPYRPWPGFMMRWALNKSNYNNGQLVFQYITSTGATTNIKICNANSTMAATGLFDITVTYDPQKIENDYKFIVVDNLNSKTLARTDIVFSDNEMDYTLGYAISQAGTPYRYSTVTIYDFSISRI